MRNIEGSRVLFLEEVAGDLVTVVGGGLIPAARPLQEKKEKKKKGEKGGGKELNLIFRFRV